MSVFKVTEAEAAVLTKMSGGGEAPKEIALCKPCSRLMTNKDTALQLIRGTIVAGFRASGVHTRMAEASADFFCKKLADATPKTPVS